MPAVSPTSWAVVNTSEQVGWNVAWQGQFEMFGSDYVQTISHGQIVDLTTSYYNTSSQVWVDINGYIQQSFVLPYNGTYRLSYLQESRSTHYSGYVAEIYWDDILITTAIPDTTDVTNETIMIDAKAGNHTLKFVEIGD